MKTKEEYLLALDRIDNAYNNFDRSISAVGMFIQDFNLLLGLVNEHFEEKQKTKEETNFEHYKDRILDCCIDNLAVVKGIPKSCSKIDCNDCDFLTIQKECCEIAKDWLKQPYKKLTYKLNKFEIDLLQSCSQGYLSKYQFKNINSLTEMRKNGYFKCINRDETIEEILAKCEVMD